MNDVWRRTLGLVRDTALALGVTVMLAASMVLGADGKPFLIGKQTRPWR